jgi:uncharacterized membrane protein YeaQ/YmgE (transglycosylase-associated protein family)
MVLEVLHQLANDVFVWIGFGTLAGLFAKAILPGRDSGGTVATVLMGVGGTAVGLGLVALFFDRKHVTPLSGLGFVAGTFGAVFILLFHRLLSGRFFREEGTGVGVSAPRARKRVLTINRE